MMQNLQALPPFEPITVFPEYLKGAEHAIVSGDVQGAMAELSRVLQQMPNDYLALTMMAAALRKQGQLQEAERFCAQVLSMHPGFYPALVERARLAMAQGQREDAATWYQLAHQQMPSTAEILMEWAQLLETIGRWQDAVKVLEHAHHLAPQEHGFVFQKGLILQAQQQHAAALEAYRPLLAVQPPLRMLFNNYAASLVELGRHDEARAYLEAAVQSEPENHYGWVNLASWYRQNKELEKAEQASLEALRLEPNYAIAHNNYGLTLNEMQRWAEADACFVKAMTLDHDYEGARWNLAMARLRMGDYVSGWPLHEARWAGSSELRDKQHNLPVPQWQGESLKGKTLFVWGEQGLGDALQFSRYVPLIIERAKAEGGRVEYCCFKALHTLFSNTFQPLLSTRIMRDDDRPLPAFDLHCPLMMLPMMFETRVETIPNHVPYLRPTEERVAYWRERLAADKKLRVGLVWTGSLTHQRNPYRAVGVEAYTRFQDIPNASFYSLQFHAQADIAKAAEMGLNITDWTPEIGDFNDSAALMENLDLVITVCTSTSHLAGALGVKTWVPLDVNPHWVWLLEREDSPWYPHTKLYRQKNYLEWEPVLQRMYADLRVLAAEKASA